MFNEYRVSAWEDEKALEMDGGDGCPTMLMCYLMPLNLHLEMVKNSKLYFMYIFIVRKKLKHSQGTQF